MQNWESTTSRALRALRVETIRRKILFFATLATLIPSVSTAILSYVYNRRALTQKVTEMLRSTSSQGAREVDLWMKERLYEVRVFESSYLVPEAVDRARAGGAATVALGRLRDYLSSVKQRFPDHQELLVVDHDGRTVASSAAAPTGPLRLPSDWVEQARTRDAILGQVYWDSAAGMPMMVLGVPITTTDGRFLGALAAKVTLVPLVNTLQNLAQERSATLNLVTVRGTLLTSSASTTPELLNQRMTRATLDQLEGSPRGVVTYHNRVAEEVLGALAPIERLDWAVVAELPARDAYAPIARLRVLTFLTVSALLVVIGALAYLLGLTIALPLDRLAHGAREVAAGDLTTAVPVLGGGEVAYVTEVFNDMVTRLRQGRDELERLSRTDGLTGLPNRRYLMETVEKEILRAQRNQRPFSLMMIDVDHFKQYNDAFGHLAGDEVLTRLGEALSETIRSADYCGRYGGEEFTALLPDTPLEQATEVAERIRARMAEHSFGEDRPAVTLSIGIGECPTDGDTLEAVLARADAAMYHAKQTGRDRVATTAMLRNTSTDDGPASVRPGTAARTRKKKPN